MSRRKVQTHALPVRISHWLMAVSIIIMVGSGCRIYNISPLLPFGFPGWATLGGDPQKALALHGDPGAATSIAWHLAGMWLLFASFLMFILWGVLSGHFWHDFLPVSPRSFWRDFTAAARFKLKHTVGEYNAVQKLFYWCVLALVVLMLLTGAVLWKPVQTYPLERLFGGFQGARIVHFCGMVCIVGFLAVHLALVALVPSTLIAMITGRSGHVSHELEKTE